MKYNVNIIPYNINIEVEEGTNLLDAQILAGLHPDAPCGGQGTCGKCVVDIITDAGKERVKACKYEVRSDVTVRVRSDGEHNLLESGAGRAFRLAPAIKCAPVQVERCTLGENSSDWERLRRAVAESLDIPKESIPVNANLAKDIHSILEDNGYEVTAVMYNSEIIDIRKDVKPYAVAVDIGTTSVVVYLLDLEKGCEISHASTLNPQSEFGADVIARAEAAAGGKGAELADVIRTAINGLVDEALSQAPGVSKDDIYLMTVAGNTCMHHLFMEINPAYNAL